MGSLRLHQLQLLGFRNYTRLNLELSEKRLLIIGQNGVGKSNLLEAVELLGSLRSHRASSDQDLINWDAKEACLRAVANESERLELQLRRKGGRQALLNEKCLTRQVDLIGPLRCVGFSALDLDLVRGQPVLRRTWLDRVVLQLEPIYSDLISRYNKLIRQRSQLWKKWGFQNNQDFDQILDAFDMQMSLVSTRIHRRRSRALTHLQPLAFKWQEILSGGKENFKIEYLPGSILDSQEEEERWRLAIQNQLLEQRIEERRLGSCKVGPHRDEVAFLINGSLARRFASSGQQRTLVLSLKLAELELLEKLYGEPPLLLLDDVLAELDPMRQLLLLEAVGEKHQCLVSATHLECFEGKWKKSSQVINGESLRLSS